MMIYAGRCIPTEAARTMLRSAILAFAESGIGCSFQT